MSNYHQEQERKHLTRLEEIRKELPPFMREFFRSKSDSLSSRTRLSYAYDLRLFFNFLLTDFPEFPAQNMFDLTIEDLAKINSEHIEEFMEYLSYYVSKRDETELNVQNQINSKGRKLATLRTVFSYFYKKGKITGNPAELVDTPPVKEKAKVYLEADEIANLLDAVDEGKSLSAHQRRFHAYTRSRDVAMLTLFAGTGIRVSECVGLNIQDVDLDRGSFRVIRKGGDEAILFFNEETEIALREYMEQRLNIKALEGHENALFLSIQNRRITTRAVQNLVKKYSELTNSLKKITPHKLRSSFGTNMYRETGDIYLVADLLGHSDVNTTRKNYADTKQEAGRRAVRNLKLRGDD
ncbi:MAG: tyrosine-type recombinase/integrase [Defluviitaleaceae bacterium]|nr:tyrosine-type recombinase/integrase [Defluviitaleaceae bacterium]